MIAILISRLSRVGTIPVFGWEVKEVEDILMIGDEEAGGVEFLVMMGDIFGKLWRMVVVDLDGPVDLCGFVRICVGRLFSGAGR